MAKDSKLPPGRGDGKTMAQMWKEFGRFIRAEDVKGTNRGDDRNKTAANRAAKLKKDMYSPPYPSAAPKRPTRGGGSLQGDLKKFGDAVKRNKTAVSSKAKKNNKMDKGY